MKKIGIGLLALIAGIAGGAIGTEKIMGNKTKKIRKLSDKHLDLFLMMNQWVKVKQEGKNVSLFFESNGYKRIAIYGMGAVGEILINELKGTDVQIVYGIDQKADSVCVEIDVVTPEEELDVVDAVVVTAISFFDEIEESINGKVNCPIISLEDILFEL